MNRHAMHLALVMQERNKSGVPCTGVECIKIAKRSEYFRVSARFQEKNVTIHMIA